MPTHGNILATAVRALIETRGAMVLRRHFAVSAACIVAVCCLWACSDDTPVPPASQQPGTDRADGEPQPLEMNLLLRVPSLSRYTPGKASRTLGARSGDEEDGTRVNGVLPFDPDRENRITQVAVAFFSRDSLGRCDSLLMVQPAKYIKRDEVTPQVYSFKVSFYAQDPDDFASQYNAVILANYPDALAVLYPGMTYGQMKQALVKTFTPPATPAAPGKPGTATTPGDEPQGPLYPPQLPVDEETPLPMWGEIAGVSFPKEEDTSVPTYSATLLRSVARVDVTVDSEILPEDFELVSISVVNAASALAVVPDSANVEPDSIQSGHLHAVRPTLPQGVDYNQRWDYDSVAIDNIISHTVYIPEADIMLDSEPGATVDPSAGGDVTDMPAGVSTARPGDANHTRRTAIVIGARYHGSDSLHYYRIDFMDRAGDSLVNVRRNHLYNFRITKADCEGAESVMDAYNDPVSSLEAELIEWELPHHALTWCGNDWISASREQLNLVGRETAGLVIEVKSSLPLTTFRVHWSDDSLVSYHSDHTLSPSGVAAEVEVNGDLARVAVIVTEDVPPGAEPKVLQLSMRVSAQLKINIPVVIYPVDPWAWGGGDTFDRDLDASKTPSLEGETDGGDDPPGTQQE